MPGRYKTLILDELSVVDSPANIGAVHVLAKRQEKPSLLSRLIEKVTAAVRSSGDAGLSPEQIRQLAKDAESFNDVQNEDKVNRALWDATSALSQSIGSILCDDALDAAAKSSAIATSIAQFQTAVGDLPALTTQDPADGDQSAVGKGGDMTKDEVEAIAKAAAAAAIVGPLETIGKLTEQVTKADATIASQAAELVVLKGNQGDAELTAVVKSAIGVAPIDVAAQVTVLKELSPAAREVHLATLRQSAELAKHNALFTAFGSPGRKLTKSDSDLIEARAAEIRKAQPLLTAEQAFTKALDENPDAYAAAMADGGTHVR